LISEKVASLKSLKQLTKISKNIRPKDRDVLYRKFGSEVEQINFDKINETISAREIAMNATKGVSAGVSSALGAWALVSTFLTCRKQHQENFSFAATGQGTQTVRLKSPASLIYPS
jgi:hypothetical protein